MSPTCHSYRAYLAGNTFATVEDTLSEIEEFIARAGYTRDDGSIVPLLTFRRQFNQWLADPIRQTYFAQRDRVESALAVAGFSTGWTWIKPPFKHDRGNCELIIANMGGGFGARSLAQRTLVFDPELRVILARDLTPDEQRQIA